MARKGDSIGKRLGVGDAKKSGNYEILGIVQDAKYQDAREPAYATFFLPFLQQSKDPKLSWLVYSQYLGDIELEVAGKPQNLEAEVDRKSTRLNSSH